jgi:caffeoyl-CoA O-methyltransferase
MTDPLYQYVLSNWSRESDTLKALRRETEQLEMSQMQISPDQGQFMAFLVKMIDARRIIEIGTFTGYSALAMAEVIDHDALITCCDVSEEWTNTAKNYWHKAELSAKIDLRLGPALITLDALLANERGSFDFAFIDADKTNYDAYYEACLSLVRAGGLIAIDNVFWGGWVADPQQQDEDTQAIRALNEKLHSDERIDLSIVPIGDGLTLARKR